MEEMTVFSNALNTAVPAVAFLYLSEFFQTT
jgi:hypothetical protein